MRDEKALTVGAQEERDFLEMAGRKPWLRSDMFLNWQALINSALTKPITISATCYSGTGKKTCQHNFSITEIILGFKNYDTTIDCPQCQTKVTPELRAETGLLLLMSPATTLRDMAELTEPKNWLRNKANTITLVHNAQLYFGGVYQAFKAMEMEPPVSRPQPPENWLGISRKFYDKVPRFWLKEALSLSDEQLAQI